MKRIAAFFAALVTGIALAATLVAPSASAIEWKCGKAGFKGQSQVCIAWDTRGYNAKVVARDDVYNRIADFMLVCGAGRWYGSVGAWRIEQTKDYTYVFSVGSKGSCQVVLSIGGEEWKSPSLSR
jgi:hypothetical protein